MFHLDLRVFLTDVMAMFIRHLKNPPILYLLIILLLGRPAATPGYAWGVAADNHGLRNEAVVGDCVSDDCVEGAQSRWGNSPPRKDSQPGSPIPGNAPPTSVAQVLLPERNLGTHLVAVPPPRIPDQILHHRTIVLLI